MIIKPLLHFSMIDIHQSLFQKFINPFILYRSIITLISLTALTACNQQIDNVEIQKQTLSKQAPSLNSTYGRNALFSYPDFVGDYQVSSHSLVVEDVSRIETFITDSIENRKLHIRFYYPTSSQSKTDLLKNENQKKLDVIDINTWEYLIGHQEIKGKLLRFDNYLNAKWDIVLNKAVSIKQPKFPVLIFSHGYGFNAESYSALSAELASKGYIVVSINHTYGANPSNITDSEITDSNVLNNKTKNLTWAKPFLNDNIGAFLPIWSQDQSFVINQLYEINNDANSLFFEKLDLQNLGVFGHSYGGAAAYYTASQDPRVKAVIDIDGTIFNFEDKYITQPFAFILSKNHQPRFTYSNTSNISYQVTLPQFEHNSFTDHILWWQWDHDDLALGFGDVEAYRAIELTTELVSDFFDTFLLGKNTNWFNMNDHNQIKITNEVILINKSSNN